jgi:aminoglycoside 6'-N-acetyltransferase I
MPTAIQIMNCPPDENMITQAAEILVAAFAENWPDAWPTLTDALEEVHEMLAGDRIMRVAITEEHGAQKIVGWIGGIEEYDGHVWELHPLAVHPDFQGRGIGRALVIDFEVQVRQKGGITVRLGSDDENGMTSLSNTDLYENLWEKIATIQNFKGHPYEFYQKLGYTIIGVIPDANGVGKPDILMAKRVAPS